MTLRAIAIYCRHADYVGFSSRFTLSSFQSHVCVLHGNLTLVAFQDVSLGRRLLGVPRVRHQLCVHTEQRVLWLPTQPSEGDGYAGLATTGYC